MSEPRVTIAKWQPIPDTFARPTRTGVAITRNTRDGGMPNQCLVRVYEPSEGPPVAIVTERFADWASNRYITPEESGLTIPHDGFASWRTNNAGIKVAVNGDAGRACRHIERIILDELPHRVGHTELTVIRHFQPHRREQSWWLMKRGCLLGGSDNYPDITFEADTDAGRASALGLRLTERHVKAITESAVEPLTPQQLGYWGPIRQTGHRLVCGLIN